MNISDYFVKPIWEYSGYNPINTAVYLFLFLLGLLVLERRLELGREDFESYAPLIVLAGILRVAEDVKILPRTYLTVSPGYFLLFFLVGAVELKLNPEARRLVNLSFLLLIGTLLSSINPNFLPALVLGLAILSLPAELKIIAGALLDSLIPLFLVLNCSYFEQHVVSSLLISHFPWAYVLIKVSLALAVVFFRFPWLYKLAALAITLGPGIRNTARFFVQGCII